MAVSGKLDGVLSRIDGIIDESPALTKVGIPLYSFQLLKLSQPQFDRAPGKPRLAYQKGVQVAEEFFKETPRHLSSYCRRST